MIAGQLAVVAIPVFGWLTSGYDIMPDIGRLSSGQKWVIGLYTIAFLAAVIYASFATWRCFNDLWKLHIPETKKRITWLLGLPVPGCLLIPVFLLIFSAGTRKSVKRLARLYFAWTILALCLLTIIYFMALKWLPTAAVILLPLSCLFMWTTALALAKKPVFSWKSLTCISLFFAMLAGPLLATGFYLHRVEQRLIDGREKLMHVYKYPLNGAALRESYYHGEKSNYHKFSGIFRYDQQKHDNEMSLRIPANLEMFYDTSVVNAGQCRELDRWLHGNQTTFRDWDQLLEKEKYFKMPEDIRDYDSLLFGLLLPELYPFRTIARINLLRVRGAINNHDVREALKAFYSSQRILDYALDDQFVVSMLVAISIESINMEQIQKILTGNPDQTQIIKIIGLLERNKGNWEKVFRRGIYGDAVCSLDGHLTVTRIAGEFLLFKTGYFSSETDVRRLEDEFFDFNHYLFSFLLAPVKSVWLEDFIYTVNTLALYPQIPPSPEAKKAVSHIPDEFLFSKMVLLFGYDKVYEKMLSIRAREGAAIMALNAELYRRKYGKLPDSLHDMVPEFIQEVYNDPFTGQSLKYEKGDFLSIMSDCRNVSVPHPNPELIKVRGYRIYSVGPDKHDDNGLHGDIKKKRYDDPGFSVIEKILSPVAKPVL